MAYAATKKADFGPPPQKDSAGTSEEPLKQSADCDDPQWGDLLMPLPIRYQFPSNKPHGYIYPKVLVLDMNDVLLRRYKTFPKDASLPQNHNFIMGNMRRAEFAPVINCIVRPDAQNFLNHIATMFFPVLWSSCTEENLTATMVSFFTGHPKMWKDVLS